MFCRQHGFDLRIVDLGVDYDLSGVPGIIDHKIARGTRNFRYEAAMSEEEFDRSIEIGAQLTDECAEQGCNILCIGEMGIGNTSPSSIWMSLMGNIPLDECIGAGAGLGADGIAHKRMVLKEAVRNYECGMRNEEFEGQEARDKEQEISDRTLSPKPSTLNLFRYFGGFEMTGAIGAMLRAAERGMLIMVDGFIMSACMLAASRLYPEVLNYAIFCHCGDESGHGRMLNLMNAEPLLRLGLRLGEGTGALCAYPIIESAVRMVNEMNNFDNASITKYF